MTDDADGDGEVAEEVEDTDLVGGVSEGDDSDDDVEDDAHRRFESWRQRSGLGAVGTGIARGLQAVFQPAENQQVISAPIPGGPPDDDEGIRVILDPDDPTKSVGLIRGSDDGERAPGDQADGVEPPT